jgi:hypothetical protein
MGFGCSRGWCCVNMRGSIASNTGLEKIHYEELQSLKLLKLFFE